MIILSLYWSADQMRFERLALSVFPKKHHQRIRQIWRSVETGVGAYVRSEVIQSVLAGIILGTGYGLMGVPYPTILAISSVPYPAVANSTIRARCTIKYGWRPRRTTSRRSRFNCREIRKGSGLGPRAMPSRSICHHFYSRNPDRTSGSWY